MMENRAYEDEANKAAHHLHQQFLQQQGYHPAPPQSPQQFLLPPPPNHLHHHHHHHHPQMQPHPQQFVQATMFDGYRNSPGHGPECHVYEDIAYSLEPGVGAFQRNLTLPLRRTSQSCESLEGVSSSVRVTSRERRDRASVIDRLTERSQESSLDNSLVSCNSVERLSRRRRKKDCRHCRSKAVHPEELVHHQHHHQSQSPTPQQQHPGDVYEERNAELRAIFGLPPGLCHLAPAGCLGPPVVYAIGCNSAECANNADSTRFAHVDAGDKGLITPPHPQQPQPQQQQPLVTTAGGGPHQQRNRAGMKVNSIYAQDQHWHKDPRTIFLNDHHPKEQDLASPFQRGYSANSPTSDNRTNLRRSIHEDSPTGSHPARLRKHHNGWTLQFGRPLGVLNASTIGCTKSLVLLLVLVLALLGIGGTALYIVFEPEKLHVIQQYLRSGKNTTTTSFAGDNNELVVDFEEPVSSTTLSTTTTMMMTLLSVPSTPSLVFEGNDVPSDLQPVYETATRTDGKGRLSTLLVPSTTTTTSTTRSTTSTTTWSTTSSSTTESSLELFRGCAECVGDEVCVARNADEPARCQRPRDRTDPNGCGGLCDYNLESCHEDTEPGSYRCVETEHHCLSDEWTCRNIFCIPLVKRCDGQMNCYDHSDEYNCECDLNTHFHCGNQTSCLPLSKKCDGHVDCFDATDEENCTASLSVVAECPSHDERTCANKQQCFLKTRFCDGYKDCADGSDEPVGCGFGRCNKHEFSCRNGRCIDKILKCNGADDCGDGSDEKHCREQRM